VHFVREQYGGHECTTSREPDPGVQGVAAVVTGADQQDDAGAVRVTEKVADGNR
jgi:hypothetical protein